MSRVALAFSGGLDTTVCVPLLREEYDYDEVLGVTVDVGQPREELAAAAEKAETLGVAHRVVDARADFAATCFDAVRANATYQGYPLGTALARPVIASAILAEAKEADCTALAHGCTGKGNDQLRFEVVWRASDLEVVAPIRELGLTREAERAYAAERGLAVEGGDGGRYSIDTNLWTRSIEGDDLEDPSTIPDGDIYEWTTDPGGVAPETVEIAFESGYPVALDGESLPPVALIDALNEQAGPHGVGRTDIMEDRLLGLKVRENYEHPAATTLLAAHEALEGLVLTADERSFKARVDDEWAEQAYAGLVESPLSAALEGFIEATQARVTGTVTIKFEGGQARPVARESEHAAYSAAAASFDESTVLGIEQADATGVAKYHGFQARLAAGSMAPPTEETGGGDSGTDTTALGPGS